MALKWEMVDPDLYRPTKESAKYLTRVPLKVGDENIPYSSATISGFVFSAEAMISLGFGTFVQSNLEVGVLFHVLEVAAYKNVVKVVDQNKSEIRLEQTGVGFRVALAVSNIDFDLAVNVGQVAAAAEIKNANVNIDVKVYGAALEQLGFLKKLTQLQKFDSNYLQLVSTSAANLTKYLAKNGDNISPDTMKISPLAVPNQSPFNSSYSIDEGINSIWYGRSLEEALKWASTEPRRWEKVDALTVEATYRSFGILSDIQKPSERQRDDAYQALVAGDFY